MSALPRQLVPLLVLALVVGAAAWLLLDEQDETAGDVVRREGPPPPPEARLVGSREASEPSTDAARESEAVWWHLGFRVEGPDAAPHPFTKAWLVNGKGRVARTLVPKSTASEGELLVSGACRLVVRAEGLPPWSSDRLVPPKTGRRDVVARLVPGLPLAGVVYRADRETPLPEHDVTVEAIPRVGAFATTWHRTKTDPEGRFSLTNLPPGRVRIAVCVMVHSGERRTTVVADAGDDDVRVVTEAGDPTCKLPVFVTDIEAGHAPDDTRIAVYVTVDGREMLWVRRRLEPREEPPKAWYLGTFDARRVSTVQFRLAALGYEQPEPLVYRVPDDEGPHRVHLSVRPRPDQIARVTIRILTSGGPSPRIVNVICDHPSMRVRLEHRVVNDRISLRLPPGRNGLTVETPYRRDAEHGFTQALVGDVVVEMEAGEQRNLDLPLVPGGFVFLVGDRDAWCPTFHLRRGNEEITREAGLRKWKEGEDRCWVVGPVSPGTWTLAYDGTDTRWEGDVVVRGGEVTIVRRDQLKPVASIPPVDDE